MKNLKITFGIMLMNLLFVKNLSAQTPDEGGSLGIKGGINITKYSLREAAAASSPGFNIGIFSSGALSENFAIQPELNLNVFRSDITLGSETGNKKFSLTMAYPEFVLLLNIQCKKLYAQFGPYVSYLAYIHTENSGEDISGIVSRRNFYDIDYGLVYSAGYQLKRWDVGVRYNGGLFKFGKPNSENGNPNIFREAKTSSLQFCVGYYF